jgi:hypothetical protein
MDIKWISDTTNDDELLARTFSLHEDVKPIARGLLLPEMCDMDPLRQLLNACLTSFDIEIVKITSREVHEIHIDLESER